MARKIIDTSKEAFNSLDPSQLAEIYRNILYALAKLRYATTEEVAAFLKIDHSKCWKRFSELERQELIYRPGIKKILKSGRMGHTWGLRDKAIPKTEDELKALKGMPTIQDISRNIQIISEQFKQLSLL
jgi:hypothetical protein